MKKLVILNILTLRTLHIYIHIFTWETNRHFLMDHCPVKEVYKLLIDSQLQSSHTGLGDFELF